MKTPREMSEEALQKHKESFRSAVAVSFCAARMAAGSAHAVDVLNILEPAVAELIRRATDAGYECRGILAEHEAVLAEAGK